MSASDLVAQLRLAGDPLHLTAADALNESRSQVECLLARVRQLEAIARLNGETIRAMQRAAVERWREPAKFRCICNELHDASDGHVCRSE